MRIWDDSLERIQKPQITEQGSEKKNVEGINSGLGPWIQKPGWTKDLKLLKREGGPRQMQNYI